MSGGWSRLASDCSGRGCSFTHAPRGLDCLRCRFSRYMAASAKSNA